MSVLEDMMRWPQAAGARPSCAVLGWCVCLALALVCGGQPVGSGEAAGGELTADDGEQEQQSVTSAGSGSPLPLDAVVATVNGEKLCVRDVERLVAEATGGRPVVAEGLPRLRAEALEQLIHRKLVLAELTRRKLLPAEQEVEAALDALRQQLARRQIAFDAYLEQRLHTEESLRRQIVWDLAWRSYVLSELSEQALQQAFARHQKHVDGTEVRVSHILIRVPDAKDSASLQAAIDRAHRIREEILAGQLTFAQAAEKYSAGPSRRRGGDLGFIPRRDRMVETFSAAAFALEVGEISQPVVTQFGVHLILCTEIKPGTKTWSDVRGELELIVARERFDALAAELRPKASIEYTGVYPYLEGGRLVLPKQ